MGKERELNIGIVTDTCALYPPDKGEQLGIKRAHLRVEFGTESFADETEITPSSFVEKLKQIRVHPKSSAAPPGELLEIYRQLSRACRKILSVHLPSFASGTLSSAKVAAEQFREESETEVEVIDARQLLGTQGFLVLEAARLARQGVQDYHILERIRDLSKKCLTVAMGIDLDFVEKGGRIPKPIIAILNRGTQFLHIIPMISIREATKGLDIRPVLPPPRTEDQAFKKFLQIAKKEGKLKKVAVMHFRAEERAKRLQKELEEALGGNIPILEAPCAVGTHSGLDTVGFSLLKN